jgi:hypothetical protein
MKPVPIPLEMGLGSSFFYSLGSLYYDTERQTCRVLRDKCRTRMSEKRTLMRISGRKRKDATKRWRKP